MRSSIGWVCTTLAVLALGCSLATTRGNLIEIDMALEALPAEGLAVGHAHTIDEPPWEIELLEARLIVGALYLFPPRQTPMTGLRWLLGPPIARAHGGDDNEAGSNAIAEHLDQVVIDALMLEPLELGRHLAEAGTLDRASVFLDHPRRELASMGAEGPTHGHLAWVRARARRDGYIVEVSAGLDIENTPLRRRVDRVRPESEAALTDGDRVVVGVRASEWLAEVDFGALVAQMAAEPGGPPIVVTVESPSQLHNAWQIALARPSSFAVRVEESSDE